MATTFAKATDHSGATSVHAGSDAQERAGGAKRLVFAGQSLPSVCSVGLRYSLLVALFACGSACVTDTLMESGLISEEAVLERLRGESENVPAIYFVGDMPAAQQGRLGSQTNIRLFYDPSRLLDCYRGSGAPPGWFIRACSRVDDGAEQCLDVIREDGPEPGDWQILVPGAPGELALWFETGASSGCRARDDNDGELYRFDIEDDAQKRIEDILRDRIVDHLDPGDGR